MTGKRTDYITWDEYFMGVAILAGKRSKDPSTQVGACIVSPDNKILSMGYNGFPKGCSDDEFPWERENEADDPYNAKDVYKRQPWDYGAGALLVKEAGGCVTDFEGREPALNRPCCVVAGTPGIHRALLERYL